VISLLIALGIGFFIGMLPSLPFIDLYHWGVGLVISSGISVFTFAKLSQKVNKEFAPLLEKANSFMQSQKWRQAIDVLESGRVFKNRMFLVEGQIEAQIGMVYYFQGKESEAYEHFKLATPRNWFAMLAYSYLMLKFKKPDEMIEQFELTLKVNKKEVIVWNAYAFCLDKISKRDEAIEVLNRAIKKLGENPETQANLNALQNGRKMNMKPFGEMWYGLKIERAPKQMAQRSPNHPGYRGFKQKKRMR